MLRLSTKNKTDVVDTDDVGEDVDIGLIIWNSLYGWVFGTESSEDEAIKDNEELEVNNPVGDPEITNGEDIFPIGFFGEETHLEYFYIASFLFLSYLIVILVKQSIRISRKRAVLLQKLKKLQPEAGSINSNQAVLRQISFH